MKHSTTLLAVLSLAIGTGAQQAAAPEPYSVKGDKLGETSAEWLASNPNHKTWTCGDVSGIAEGKTVYCFSGIFELVKMGDTYQPSSDGTYAGGLLQDESVSFVAKDGKLILYQIEMTFDNQFCLTPLMPALSDKFGSSPEHRVTPLQNAFGAQFERTTWKWTNGVTSLELVYALGVPHDHPSVTFTLDTLFKEVKGRQDKAEHNKARSDM